MIKIKVGDEFQNNKGSSYTVIDYKNYNNVKIKFNDEFAHETITNIKCMSKGVVKNPFLPIVFNKGYFGVGVFKAKLGSAAKGFPLTPEYAAWTNMLSRCYYDKEISRVIGYKTYENSLVDESWLNFQLFAKWFTDEKKRIDAIMPGLKLAVDSDLLKDGIKLYSEKTCCLIPAEINSSICFTLSKDGNPKFIRKTKQGLFTVTLSFKESNSYVKNLDSLDTAIKVYIEHKISIISNYIIKYKDVLKPEATLALQKYSNTFRDYFS